jgi:RNA polymerase sigma factor (sigma-70 family)
MKTRKQSSLARLLSRMLQARQAGGLSDAQLLERFVIRRDEAAFEVLLWRHGPTVLGVCRRVLRHEQDAEDAFQATFLVLARKAGSIGTGQALGSWLYRVAQRVAVRAKVLAGKRAARQAPLADVAADPAPDPAWSDLRRVLDEEVSRLPEKYRAPFVLCYLDGKTNADAARALGCPKGTVLSRLAWARQRLRARLTRRGLGLSAGLVAAGLAAKPAAAMVRAALVEASLRVVLAGTTRRAVGAPVPGQVAALTQGVLQAMLWTKIKIVIGCVLAIGGLGLGGNVLLQETTPSKVTAAPPPAAQQAPASRPADNAVSPKAEAKRYPFEVRNKKWSEVLEWLSDQTGLPVVAPSVPTGTFTFISPRPTDQAKRTYTLSEVIDFINEGLLANPTQKFFLIRRPASFNVLLADEKIDPTLLPQIAPDELDKRGKTELVRVMLPLTSLNAKDIGPEVKKMMGPFGEVIVVGFSNSLLLQDTAGNLARIRQTIQAVERRGGAKKQ